MKISINVNTLTVFLCKTSTILYLLVLVSLKAGSIRAFMSSSSIASLSNSALSTETMKKFCNALTKDENKLFSVLIDSLKYNQRKTVVRVVGGWVRDKLLGMSSEDIDIALDDQSGVEFANNVNSYLKTIGEDVRKISVIQVTMYIIMVDVYIIYVYKGIDS
jgi:hypothetical protein